MSTCKTVTAEDRVEAHPVPPATVTPGHSLEPTSVPFGLPPTSILGAVPPACERVLRGDTDTTGRIIILTLADFGIDTQLKSVESGPVVTRYELVPATDVNVERIANLSDALALSLRSRSVRVQAPILGKGTVDVEVHNINTTAVYQREIIEGPVWDPSKFELPIVIGRDVDGNDLVADLTTLPHLLIAGAMGSGKTVCMNTILAGLLMSRTPEQLQLMLIDPKIVEFYVCNNLPHLVGAQKAVITDPKHVIGGLRWAITEMERRYKMLAAVGVRNIKDFNQRPIEKQALSGVGGDKAVDCQPERLPYIVIVIDELADMMLTAGAEMDGYMARLTQLSHAIGIHMIIATQRPSVNVITAPIRANFPARIAFQVAQTKDSRLILDANGAETLVGRGDMLFRPTVSSRLIRAQGALTTDEDIRNIVGFIKQQVPHPPVSAEPGGATATETARQSTATPIAFQSGEQPSFDQMLANGRGGDDGDDELIEMSLEIIRQTGCASTSSLQRRLRIGYTRAARVMDMLEERGVVGPASGAEPRKVLIC